ncbi:MAG TPA: FAD-dependent monooxygenase, partial [Jatrophihabitans sp.]
MRIAVVGGGPGGLYFAALMKQLDANHDITVWERNARDDTFGFGVVFSDETLGGIEHADERIFTQMQAEFARWDDIDVHFRGRTLTSGGHGFAAMSRKRLLEILQDRGAGLGVRLHFCTPAPDVADLAAEYDLVVACDGVNSAVRTAYAQRFRPSLEQRQCKYMWLGTSRVFDAFKFYVRETPHGVMQIHGYPYDARGSTFIVEMNDAVWRRAGFDAFADREFRSGESDEKSVDLIRDWFADVLDGHDVLMNNSKWLNFTTVRNKTWRHGNIVLMGDAAHTAHFSIGSGTKLALEDAIELARSIGQHPGDLAAALKHYEDLRSIEVLKIQNAARNSTEWFEHVDRYVNLPPEQFAYSLLTRSQRISHENLRLRDKGYVEDYEDWIAERAGKLRAPLQSSIPPMLTPFTLRGVTLKNRVVVSPMAQYSCVDGMP